MNSNISKKNILLSLGMLALLVNTGEVKSKQIVKQMEYFEKVNTPQILQSIDALLLEAQGTNSDDNTSRPGIWKDAINAPDAGANINYKPIPGYNTSTAILPPEIKNIWNNTLMLFGANADGLNIGTGFIVAPYGEEQAVVFSALHVIQDFCKIPTNGDFASGNFACENLFSLHDVAIDTASNKAVYDGASPWKSPVIEILHYDKRNDFVAFVMDVPASFVFKPIKLEADYEVADPKIAAGGIQFASYSNPILNHAVNKDKIKLKYFQMYLVGYASTYLGENNATYAHDKQLIRKRWAEGHYEKTQAYEPSEGMGYTKVFSHTLEMLPGVSGSPLMLQDGRVLGINVALVLNKTFIKNTAGCSRSDKIKADEYKVALPLENVTEFLTASITGGLLPKIN